MGIDEIIVFCVNDAAVMDAWAKDQGIDEKVWCARHSHHPTAALDRRARGAWFVVICDL